MEEERTNLVPRLQQGAYLPRFAAAQPGPSPKTVFRFDAIDAQSSSVTGFAGGHPFASSHASASPYSVINHGNVDEHSYNSYAPSTNTFAPGLPTADISNRYVADSFDNHNALRYAANASLSAHPQTLSTDAFDFTGTTYAEGGYGGVHDALQYYSDPSNHPFAIDAAFNGTDTFATASNLSTNGHVLANSPCPMPASNNPIVPLDIGLMTGDTFAPSPNMYTTGRASANYPFSMQGSADPILPMDMGSMIESPITLPPNNYTTSQASASNPLPMPTSNNSLIPVDIGSPASQRALCKKCNQTFKRQSDLERHALKHGPKNIKCQVLGCKYRTYRKDKLGEHMRRRHATGGSHSN